MDFVGGRFDRYLQDSSVADAGRFDQRGSSGRPTLQCSVGACYSLSTDTSCGTLRPVVVYQGFCSFLDEDG